MAVPPMSSVLAIQMALQKRLQNLDTTVPRGPMMPGSSLYPPGRFPPVTPLPPIGGLRAQTHATRLPGQMGSYQPVPRY